METIGLIGVGVMGRTVELINEIAQAQGLGHFDTSIMWRCIHRMWEKMNS